MEKQKQEVQAWLAAGQDYKAGILLYNQYGKNTYLASQFALSQKPLHEKMLCYELCKISGLAQPVAKAAEPVKAAATKAPAKAPVKAARKAPVKAAEVQTIFQLKDLPADLETLREKLKTCHEERHVQKSKLETIKTDAKRKETVGRILALDGDIMAIEDCFDAYRENGKYTIPGLSDDTPTPFVTEVDTTDVVAVMQRIKNIGSSITKKKGKPGKEEEVKLLQAEKTYLEKFVKKGNAAK